jgi:hypothetical protein
VSDLSEEVKVCRDNIRWLDRALNRACVESARGYAHADLRAVSLQLQISEAQARLDRIERALRHEGEDQ